MFTNHYECSRCGEVWMDAWSCACNDKCPVCRAETEPSESTTFTGSRTTLKRSRAPYMQRRTVNGVGCLVSRIGHHGPQRNSNA